MFVEDNCYSPASRGPLILVGLTITGSKDEAVPYHVQKFRTTFCIDMEVNALLLTIQYKLNDFSAELQQRLVFTQLYVYHNFTTNFLLV